MLIILVLPIVAIAYIAWHLWVMLPLSTLWKSVIIAVGVLSFAMLFLNFRRVFDSMPLSVAQMAYEVGTSSLIVLLYLVLTFLMLDLGRLVHVVPKNLLYHNGYAALGILVLLLGVFIYGNLHYKDKVRVPLEIKSQKSLPREYKVVMASDLHIGYHNTRKELARWVDMMNAENPDFILIAGDIIDGSMRPIIEERMAEEFRRLKAPVWVIMSFIRVCLGLSSSTRMQVFICWLMNALSLIAVLSLLVAMIELICAANL